MRLRIAKPYQGVAARKAAVANSGLVEMEAIAQYKDKSNRGQNTMRPATSIAKRLAPRFVIAALIATSNGCLSLDTEQGLSFLAAVTGNEQTVQAGKSAAVALGVRALDTAGQPMEGLKVVWSVDPSSGGSVTEMTTLTDGAGLAQVEFTAGATLGPVLVRARAEGITVSFTMTVVAASG